MSEIVSNNVHPQNMHIGIHAESKSTPRVNDAYDGTVV